MGLQLVALVRDDEVGLPPGQLRFQPPRGFVVHHQHLERVPVRRLDGLGLLRSRAPEHGERVIKGRELRKLVLPHPQDGEGRDDEQPPYAALL